MWDFYKKQFNTAIDRVSRWYSVSLLLALLLSSGSVTAQFVPYHESGQGISPAYEGWVANDDGSFTMLFGYMNENWEEEIDLPIGLNNFFTPGEIDLGQPTHFLPRRNRNVFGIRVPADFDGELVWTLIHGESVTQKAYGTLLKDYVLEPITIMSEAGTVSGGFNNRDDVQTNEPPRVSLVGDEVRTIRVGEPIQLEVRIEDDNKPNPRTYLRGLAAFNDDDSPRQKLEKALQPPIRGTVDRVVGMTFSWFVFRGAGEVSYNPIQVKTWEDTRAFQNSPWSPFWKSPEIPVDGVVRTDITFNQAGEYTLRGRADDGGLTADVNVVVRVVE